MDATKLKNQLKKFEEHLIVDSGLSRRTVAGYSRALSIALRRMRKFCPDEKDIRKFMLWMHEKNYSYSHIVNTSIAIEHYARGKGMKLALGRPRRPKRIIQNVLSESEVADYLFRPAEALRALAAPKDADIRALVDQLKLQPVPQPSRVPPPPDAAMLPPPLRRVPVKR